MATKTVRGRLLAHLTIGALMASLVTVFAASPAQAGATLVVTTTNDELSDDTDCSLREAIQVANADDDTAEDDCVDSGTLVAGDADTIEFDVPDDTYEIDEVGDDEDLNVTGDFDITDDLTIIGGGIDETFIDGGGTPGSYDCPTGTETDRVFHVHSGTLTLEQLTVQNGIVEDADAANQELGGGILVDGDGLVLDNVLVQDNVACDDDGEEAGGGGIGMSSGDLTMTESTVDSNLAVSTSAGSYGGGLDLYGGVTLDINASTISNNTADGDTASQGGGLWASDDGTIVNSTISGNSADSGAGIYYSTSFGGTLEVDYVTITDNGDLGTADSNEETGTGLYTDGGAGVVEIQRSVIADQDDDNDDCFLDDTDDVDSLGYNMSSNDTCEFDNTTDDDDPTANVSFDGLDDNGGPTETHLSDPDSDNVDFIPEDDCDDAGDPDEDQRGEDRPDDSGEDCDAGAVELTGDEKDDTTGGSAGDELDATPETSVNILPGDASHSVTAAFDEDEIDVDDEDDINAKIISGPNADGGGDADFQCALTTDRCSFSYTSNGDEGTDVICVWNDFDGDDDYTPSGGSSDGGSCDSEAVSPSTTTDNHFTDVVSKTWEQDLPQCDDNDDNDSDGETDFPDDPGCSSADDDSESPNPTTPPPTDTQCNDGIDNDGDRDVDYPNDEGCVGLTDDTENSDGPDNVVRRYQTLLTIGFGDRRNVFRGQALSQHPRCMRNREVRLKHVDPGPNTFVGSDLTDRQGDWRVQLGSPNGRYYAVATRKSFTAGNGDLVVCLRDRSRTIKV